MSAQGAMNKVMGIIESREFVSTNKAFDPMFYLYDGSKVFNANTKEIILLMTKYIIETKSWVRDAPANGGSVSSVIYRST